VVLPILRSERKALVGVRESGSTLPNAGCSLSRALDACCNTRSAQPLYRCIVCCDVVSEGALPIVGPLTVEPPTSYLKHPRSRSAPLAVVSEAVLAVV